MYTGTVAGIHAIHPTRFSDLYGRVCSLRTLELCFRIPEDDPRNPATIADNVGDNVGDVAGMGADLFGSYVATVLASMVLGNYVIRDMGGAIDDIFGGMGPILLPLVIAAVGIIFSIFGSFFIKIKSNDAKEQEIQNALNIGNWSSIVMTAIASYFIINFMLPEIMKMDFFEVGIKEIPRMNVFGQQKVLQ